MSPLLADLVKLLELERLEINLFRGESHDIGSQRVFGGQVLGQALVAASRTVENRLVHSLHAYFLRAGDHTRPIVYDVDRSRDGASFSSRRVVAIQRGQQIFHMSASFQAPEEGLSHQAEMPQVPEPDALVDLPVWIRQHFGENTQIPKFVTRELPFEFRFVDPATFASRQPRQSDFDIWFKARGTLPDDETLHRCLLAYASDFYLISAATRRHGLYPGMANAQIASIDHAMWFHRPVRVDDWLLYSLESPSASGARGLARGNIFNRQGILVASTAQEGLMRVREDASPSSG